jgi:hypothetical protein
MHFLLMGTLYEKSSEKMLGHRDSVTKDLTLLFAIAWLSQATSMKKYETGVCSQD